MRSALDRVHPDVDDPRHPRVRLFRADPDLMSGARVDQATLADLVTVPMRSFAPGAVEARDLCPPVDWGAIILDGFVLSETIVSGRVSAEVIGPGDLIRPWEELETPFSAGRGWRALSFVDVAILGRDFDRVLSKIPSVSRQLTKRLAKRSSCTSIHLACNRLFGLQSRIMHVFEHLAYRWGRESVDGCVLPVPLTHQVVAALIGAERPPTSDALKKLIDGGHLQRTSAGCWILLDPAVSAQSPSLLARLSPSLIAPTVLPGQIADTLSALV